MVVLDAGGYDASMHRVGSILWLVVRLVAAALLIYYLGWVAGTGPFTDYTGL
jgi:hypothetical protein